MSKIAYEKLKVYILKPFHGKYKYKDYFQIYGFGERHPNGGYTVTIELAFGRNG